MYGTFSRNYPGRYVYKTSSIFGTVQNTKTTTAAMHTYQYRAGNLTPLYFVKRKKKIRIPPTDSFNYITERKRGNNGWAKRTYNDYTKEVTTWTGDLDSIAGPVEPSYATFTPAQISALDNKAVLKLLGKAKDQKVNLAQMYAERRMSAQLIGDTASRIAKMLVNIKRGNLVRAAEAVGLAVSKRAARRNGTIREFEKRMANGVLELQYGWRPLLNDAFGSAELIAQKQFREVIGTVSTMDTLIAKYSTKVKDDSNYVNYDTVSSTLLIRYKVNFTNGDDIVHSLSQVGITNPALIAWELLPWSFVIDWFLPIGSYISSLDATKGLKFLDGTKSSQLIQKVERFYTRDFTAGINRYEDTGRCSKEKVTYTRTKLESFPSGQIPSFKNPLSFEHAINAIALLQQFRRK